MKNISIKSGDNVVVIAGKDKGKTGKVIAASPKLQKVIVEGVNIVSRHTKPRSAQDQGGIIKHEAPISCSNVMVICPKCGKATRVHHTEVNGKMVRTCKCGEVLDKKYVKNAENKAESKVKKADKAEKTAKTAEKEVKTTEKTAKTTSTKKTTAKAEGKIVATKTNKAATKPAVRKSKKDV
ncbi:MAG: 50S ribosomal protein L24 [Clostridia bacterium]|nr:50S ribosomal protein L24 [Clostridia bacterium]